MPTPAPAPYPHPNSNQVYVIGGLVDRSVQKA